jgi:hypothetical protein
MPHGLSESEKFAYATFRLECTLRNGEVSSGTAFHFRLHDNGTHSVHVLVTNKHVVQDAVEGRFDFHLRDTSGAPIPGTVPITLPDFERRWFPHPDPEVDLCIMETISFTNEMIKNGHLPFVMQLGKGAILTDKEEENLVALEEVVMVGYPSGIWDPINKMPILRRGVTATHPKLDYNGRPEFLIDAACYPGCSGSPVFLYNLGVFPVKNRGVALGVRNKLLGVLYAGPQHTVEGEIQIKNIPTGKRAVVASEIPINLGVVIKAKRILDFEKVITPSPPVKP